MQDIDIPFCANPDILLRSVHYLRNKDSIVWKKNHEVTDLFEVDNEHYELGSRCCTVWLVGHHTGIKDGDRYPLTLSEFMKIVPYVKNGYWNGTLCYRKTGTRYSCKVVKNG